MGKELSCHFMIFSNTYKLKYTSIFVCHLANKKYKPCKDQNVTDRWIQKKKIKKKKKWCKNNKNIP